MLCIGIHAPSALGLVLEVQESTYYLTNNQKWESSTSTMHSQNTKATNSESYI